jgi:hypothetical protein
MGGKLTATVSPAWIVNALFVSEAVNEAPICSPTWKSTGTASPFVTTKRQIQSKYPNAEVVYELPNTSVGYQLGYGVVANFRQPGMSNSYPMRVIIMAAVKNDLALIAVAEGPFRRFSQDFGPGPPSAANTEIALDMGKYVDSCSWKGDPPR